MGHVLNQTVDEKCELVEPGQVMDGAAVWHPPQLDVPKMWSNEKKPILGHNDLGHFVLDQVNMTAFLLDAMSTQTAAWLVPN